MRKVLTKCAVIVVLAVTSVYGFSQQSTGDPTAAPTSSQTDGTDSPQDKASAPPNNDDSKAKDASDDSQKPGAMKRLKRHLRNQISSGCVNAIGNHCWDKPPADEQGADQKKKQTEQTATNNPPPRSDQKTMAGESSSRGTKIDLSPPPGEAPAPGVGIDPAEADVREFKPWDPHKADKNVEVGDFYFKRGNYRAAASRYEEALYWKDNDAIAMFRLAQTQEKLGLYSDARKNYAGYLKILPEGEFSVEANKGLERLKDKSDQPVAANRH